MNCPKCNQPLKEGAKFCTHCGTRIAPKEEPQQSQATTEQPRNDVESSQTSNPAPIAPTDLSVSDSGRIYWNIQPGQVARVISQDEIGKLQKIRGVIISEGTTAFVRVNGITIATIEGGSYDFSPIKDIAVNRTEPNAAQRSWNFLSNLFRSSKQKEIETAEEQKLKECQNKGSKFSIIVLVNKAFPLLIGAKKAELDDYKQFEPMTIQTRHLTLKVGVNAYFKIADRELFLQHFLLDKTVLNTTQIVDEITDSIHSALQSALRDAQWQGDKLPDDLRRQMKDTLNTAVKDNLFGLEIVRIVEITASNEDMERFRQLGREMFLSEQELDYLRRTNEFKNRLAEVNNAQQLQEARSAVELQRELDNINRDDLLRQDEVDKFKLLYESERRLREAQTKEDEQQALDGIRRSQMLREEEIAILQHQIDTNTYQRGQMLQMMQLKDSIEYKRVQLEGDLKRAEMTALSELNIERQRKDLEFEQLKREEELKAQRRQQQFEQFMAMEENVHKHEMEREQHKAETLRGMTWEQMTAYQGGDAATELARGYSEAKRERELAERMQQQQQAHNEQMFQLLQGMIQSGRPPQNAQPATSPTQFCPECGTKVSTEANYCPNCNKKLK